MIESPRGQPRRRISRIASLGIAVVIGLALLSISAYYQSASSPHSTVTGSSESRVASSSIETTLGVTTIHGLYPCNCSADIRWAWPANYTSLSSLKSASTFIVLANVTSAQTIGVPTTRNYGLPYDGVMPVTSYNIDITSVLFGPPSLEPGASLCVAQIGGTAGATTMSISGYPQLAMGGTFVFFLNAPGTTLTNFYASVCGGVDLVTVGGPQGLFYVQGGEVYSLDHMYPQADSWLPVKASGIPIADFITRVQSAAATG